MAAQARERPNTMNENPGTEAFASPSARLAQIANPQSEVVHFGADDPLPLDCGVKLAPFSIAYQTYGTLNAGQVQRRPGLPRPDRRPVRRQPASRHGQARLVGDMVGPGQPDRHRPLFRHLRQRDRRLHGLDRPRLDQSGDGAALRPRLPRHHHPRHGARAGAPDRPSRHPDLLCVDRRLDGRHAGAANGRRPIRTASMRPCRSPAPRATPRRTSRSTRSAARRSWPTRNGASGRYIDEGKSPRKGLAVARMAAHITYLSERRCSGSSAATCRTARS